MKNAFIKTLIELAEKDDKIVLLTGDLGYRIFDSFVEKFPNRFYNVGIAEANMASMAAGLALEGFKPYIYSIVPFVTLRCLEQIRNDIAYNNKNVKIIGVGGGFAYGHGGTTHHGIEDISIMRAIPNMQVFCPGDSFETGAIIESSYGIKSPSYIRLGRGGEQKIHTKEIKKYTIGDMLFLEMTVEKHKDLIIMSTGEMLETATKVKQELENKYISCVVVSIPTVKLLNIKQLKCVTNLSKNIITLEENTLCGGFGSCIVEHLMDLKISARLKRFGIPDCFCKITGDQEYLRDLCGLSVEKIVDETIKFF